MTFADAVSRSSSHPQRQECHRSSKVFLRTAPLAESGFRCRSIGEILPVLVLFGGWCFREIFDLQIFKDDDLTPIDKFACDFVVKVSPLVGNLAVTLCDPTSRFPTPVTSALFA